MSDEPDEALLWAREQNAQFWESLAAKGLPPETVAAKGLPPETVAAHVALARSGGYDSQLEQEAEGRRNWLEGYRAGQAASAERIKALEEDLAIWDSVFPDLLPDRLKSDKQLAEENVAAKIDAARLEGIRLGLEAAAREAVNWAVMPANFDDAIRALDPATIAKEADQ
jgi:hypothetical protein